MPTLADLESPPHSRVKGLVLGVAVGAVLIGLVVWYVLPQLVGMVTGGAKSLDARLRATDAYLAELCSGRLDPDRDGSLCGCAMQTEYPALDCQPHFNLWAVQRATAQCEDRRKEGVSYCACVETLKAKIDEVEDVDEQRSAAQPYERCQGLADAFDLPSVDSLVGE